MKKNILICVTGGIAAYKAVNLASSFMKKGANVKVQMTKSAEKFITPFTFFSITGNKVERNMFAEDSYIEHIESAEWADIILVAPATANILGKVANGIADDLISSTIIAATKPVLFVPAMNINMYANPIVQDNIKKLRNFGYFILEPESGLMACGTYGKGRFPKAKEIIFAAEVYLTRKQDLKEKSILITAGASREKLDPMRIMTNLSTGKMGIALARAAYLRGAGVTFIHSFVSEEIPYYLDAISAENAQDLYDEVMKRRKNKDYIVMCAAVADYTFAKSSKNKIKKSTNMNFEMIRTKDILQKLGELKPTDQKLIGFAAESEKLIENGRKKIEKKNLDFIVANNLNVSGKDETEAFLLSDKDEIKLTGSKFSVANRILDSIK